MTPIQILLDHHSRLDPTPDGYVVQIGLFAKHHDGSLWIPVHADSATCHGSYPINPAWADRECDITNGEELEPEDRPLRNVETGHICCIGCLSNLQWLYLDISSNLWIEEHGNTYHLYGRTYYHVVDEPCAWYQDHDDYEEGMSQEEYYTSDGYDGRKGDTMMHNYATDEWLCWTCVGLEEVE